MVLWNSVIFLTHDSLFTWNWQLFSCSEIISSLKNCWTFLLFIFELRVWVSLYCDAAQKMRPNVITWFGCVFSMTEVSLWCSMWFVNSEFWMCRPMKGNVSHSTEIGDIMSSVKTFCMNWTWLKYLLKILGSFRTSCLKCLFGVRTFPYRWRLCSRLVDNQIWCTYW